MVRTPRKRCAIYTRKSSEEGLEQSFNSLDAQREACEAYIKSQAHEGWDALGQRFDDGGVSGGTMERPALQRLLSAVEAGSVDVIVVYKVDRLTRSLADFAKIVEKLDAKDVSFVSVTQQFNTTTSMGRLTLNVLLSFAQFEREVTGERIRDKIAASKKKGMWMGGHVPVGYRAEDRGLVVESDEAETVRTLFRLYRDHGCVNAVRAEAQRFGLVSKSGKPFSRGHIYRVLSNPIYIGRIPHGAASYEGAHAAIVDAELWQAVQDRLADNRIERRQRSNAKDPSLLTGKLFGADGTRFTPSHTNKQGRRYRYYVDQSAKQSANAKPQRIPADEIEGVVIDLLRTRLGEPMNLIEALHRPDLTPAMAHAVQRAAEPLAAALKAPRQNRDLVQRLVRRITLGEEALTIDIDDAELRRALDLDAVETEDEEDAGHRIEASVAIRRRGVEQRFVLNARETDCTRQTDPGLVRALVRAHDWWTRLRDGEADGPGRIAAMDGVQSSYVSRLLPLAFLAPDIKRSILDGTVPVDLTSDRLTKHLDLPIDWKEQWRLLGFPSP